MRYSLDLSALLDGWRRYYPPDVFPGIWRGIEELIDDGDLRATEEIRVELERKDDEVLAWAQARREALFVEFDDEVQELARRVLSEHPKIIDTRNGRSGADPFVIALAMRHGCRVVAGEHPSGSLKRPKIPDVCQALGVPYLTFLDLLREQGWSF